MKKLLAVLLTLTLLMGVCAALAEDEPIKLTLWTFQALHTDLYKEMEAKWNADPDKPKIEIDYQVMPYEEMHDKLTIALQSGEGAPDLVDIEINKFANYLKGDIGLAPMNEYVEPIEDHLVMSRLNNYAKDGKYYGIDHHIGATVLDDIPDTCISEYFPTASDIVKAQMAYRLAELMDDPEQIVKDCAEELRSAIE